MNTRTPSLRSARHRITRGTSARAVASIVAGALLAVLAISPVLGHAELVSSDPAADAVLATPPTTVTLAFSAGLDAGKSSFKVVGPDGATVGTGKADRDGSKVMTADGLTLGLGVYEVEWTSVADDGDLERGTFAFAVSDPTPAPATPTQAPTDAPSTAPSGTPAATAIPAPAVTPVASEPPTGPGTPAASGGDVILPILAALVLVAVVGALVLRRNRSA